MQTKRGMKKTNIPYLCISLCLFNLSLLDEPRHFSTVVPVKYLALTILVLFNCTILIATHNIIPATPLPLDPWRIYLFHYLFIYLLIYLFYFIYFPISLFSSILFYFSILGLCEMVASTVQRQAISRTVSSYGCQAIGTYCTVLTWRIKSNLI